MNRYSEVSTISSMNLFVNKKTIVVIRLKSLNGRFHQTVDYSWLPQAGRGILLGYQPTFCEHFNFDLQLFMHLRMVMLLVNTVSVCCGGPWASLQYY